ncbi:uncharacterized protein BT62DRAFT_1006875 [Guyanagaster necrorhizus]|uniref:Uncharacterized protein n=1 Tax=Guyanagaster necrorhizus TaxID=856835 RepID=A0A9P8ARR6_9AGAR|nr:uncharacterized protein BT62DRAFT_1006875 [Guyanagaster necrorhizus MCA 3950]KAG7445191.1 hypothetical protein BT62DRAFT_1006875 [Guyanagaster necrorhizus MCA 3950]
MGDMQTDLQFPANHNTPPTAATPATYGVVVCQSRSPPWRSCFCLLYWDTFRILLQVVYLPFVSVWVSGPLPLLLMYPALGVSGGSDAGSDVERCPLLGKIHYLHMDRDGCCMRRSASVRPRRIYLCVSVRSEIQLDWVLTSLDTGSSRDRPFEGMDLGNRRAMIRYTSHAVVMSQITITLLCAKPFVYFSLVFTSLSETWLSR